MKVFKTAQTNSEAWQSLDKAIIASLNIILKQAYPTYTLKDYANPASAPVAPADGDVYLVDASDTCWGLTVTEKQLIARVSGAWAILAETLETINQKISTQNKGVKGDTGADLRYGAPWTTALPTSPLTNVLYPFAGTNAAVIGGITWYNGDHASYNGSAWTRVPFQSLTNYLAINDSDIYNVTIKVPLSAGSYYTAATARAAVPTGIRKLGLKITYATASGVWVAEQFTGANTSNWAVADNWVNQDLINQSEAIDNYCPTYMAGASSGGANIVYANNAPITKGGILATVKINSSGTGTVTVYVFTKIGTKFATISTTTVSVAAGDNQFNLRSQKIAVVAGQYVGIKSTVALKYQGSGGLGDYAINESTTVGTYTAGQEIGYGFSVQTLSTVLLDSRQTASETAISTIQANLKNNYSAAPAGGLTGVGSTAASNYLGYANYSRVGLVNKVTGYGSGTLTLVKSTLGNLSTYATIATTTAAADGSFTFNLATPINLAAGEILGILGSIIYISSGSTGSWGYTSSWFLLPATDLMYSIIYDATIDIKTIASTIDDLTNRVTKTESYVESKQVTIFDRKTTALFAGSHYKWFFGFNPIESAIIRSFNIDVNQITANSNDNIVVNVYSRSLNSSYTGVPSIANGDILLQTKTVPVSNFKQTTDTQNIQVVLNSDIISEVSKIYFFELYVKKADGGNGGISAAYNTTINYTNNWERGYFDGGTVVPSGYAIAFSVNSVFYAAKTTSEPSLLSTITESRSSFSGLISKLILRLSGKNGTAFIEKAVTHAQTTTGTATVNPYSLVYGTATQFVYMNGAWLGYKNISNVVVTRLSDSVVLTEGVDYVVHKFGKIQGVQNIASFNVSVSFSYTNEKYDLIEYDPMSGNLNLISGTERTIDAEDYLPAQTTGCISLVHVKIVGTTITDMIDLFKFDKRTNIRIGGEGELMRIQENNRKALFKVIRKLVKGQDISLGGYGDSITAIQAGSPAFTANGTLRDRVEYLSAMPADFVSTIDKYDFSDGAGTVHVKIGWNWKLKAFLESKFGITVNYYNYGIASTNSTNSNNSGLYNGLWPARIAVPVAAAHDLMVIAFGMNELGQTYTYANVKSIAQQFIAAGSCVIIMGVPRIQRSDRTTTDLANWEITNNNLMKAALDSGSAFIDPAYFTHDNFLGGMKISPDNMCAANLFNHPGPFEFSRYGELLTLLSGL